MKTSKQGYVYVVRSGDYIKVGLTSSLQERFRSYFTHNPSVSLVKAVMVSDMEAVEDEVMTLFFSQSEKPNGTDWVKFDETLLSQAFDIFKKNGGVEVELEKNLQYGARKKFEVPFTQIANTVLQNPKLSFKAKGLFGYIYSKPNDWDFSSDRISEESTDGRDSILSAMKELETLGYLSRKKKPNGRVDYFLTYDPDPKAENPIVDTQKRKTRPISKKDTTTIVNINNTNISYGEENPPEPTPASEAVSFFGMVMTQGDEFQVFVTKMSESTKFPPAFVAEELKLFTLYWTEKNKSGKKQKWEGEKTFEVRRRLVTWFNNKRTNFGRNKAGTMNGVENKYQVNFNQAQV